jgi:hypothetical protein
MSKAVNEFLQRKFVDRFLLVKNDRPHSNKAYKNGNVNLTVGEVMMV